jgi:uncharacterized protein (TIGR04255 family)
MSPVPDIPAAEHETLARPPLKTMLGQVRFPTILRIADLGVLGSFQQAIQQAWPEFDNEQQWSVVLGPQGLQQAGAARAFRFTAADRMWSTVLTTDSITVEAALEDGGYTSYEDFKERFLGLWSAVLEYFKPVAVLQQGLRYVNHIERDLPPADWADLINPELLGSIGATLSSGLVQAMCDLRFKREDGMLAFKHGLVPAGPENRPGYLLDFDCFSQQRSEDTSAEALVARFERDHASIYSFFRWCLTERALREFRDGA